MPARDPFAPLLPANCGAMPVAWQRLQIPGPPPAFALNAAERTAPSALERFARRTIQHLDAAVAADAVGPRERLALVDKAVPHALFDLMLSEVSARPRSTPTAVTPRTGHLLWQTGHNFVRFVSEPWVQHRFGLGDGELHLAVNCDPNTHDRESVQATKEFHLHLIYWRAAELAPLAAPERLSDHLDPHLRRQCLDPISFVGAALIELAVGDLLADTGVRLLPADPAAVCAGQRPPGALLRLPGWDLLASAAFEQLVRRLHRCLARCARRLLCAFTGSARPPAAWSRHRLLPRAEIARRLAALGLPAPLHADLGQLAAALGDLGPQTAPRLRRAPPALRMHVLTLNQPCYSLALSTGTANHRDAPLAQAKAVWLNLQPRLFSGIGGAGLPALRGLPSVRVERGAGHFSSADWSRRAAFQRAFAAYNQAALEAAGWGGWRFGRRARWRGLRQGWV